MSIVSKGTEFTAVNFTSSVFIVLVIELNVFQWLFTLFQLEAEGFTLGSLKVTFSTSDDLN